jgi:bifunctional non-homologous end joining protein LigD
VTDAHVEIQGHRLQLTNLDKVLYPSSGFTKAEVIKYYVEVAPVLLPHLRDRPLTVRRFPDGVQAQSFFEKHLPRGMPEWLHTADVPSSAGGGRSGRSTREGRSTGSHIRFMVVCDRASLAWVANLAALELHVPMWRVDKAGRPRPPDIMVFDLDPGEPADIVNCAEVALILAHALEEEHGWKPLAKTSGSKGLQLYVRLPSSERQRRWDDGGTRDEARHLAEQLSREHPDLIVANMRKDLRRGKVLIDWSQNNVAKTTVAPYSLRARADPTVSTPLQWQEVERCASRGRPELLHFLPADVLERVERMGDLMEPLTESMESTE